MEKSAFTPLSELFRARLLALRQQAGLTQRELAGKLEREHSFIARIELGDRRVDLMEFYWICLACGADAVREAADLMQIFGEADRLRAGRRSERGMERLLVWARDGEQAYRRSGP